MIAFNEPRSAPDQAWQAGFVALLPAIRAHARIAFRALRPEARDDAIQEAVANACVAYVRLVQLGKQDLAYPSALVRFAVKHYWAGRRVGSSMNSGDVLCRHAQRHRGFQVEQLDAGYAGRKGWSEALADNTRSPVPDQVAFRIDFPAWLAGQNCRDRRLARFLALGNCPAEAADRFGISRARISQIRQELRESWAEFQGDD